MADDPNRVRVADEPDRVRKVERGPSIWFWLVVALLVIAAIVFFFFILPGDEEADVVEPVDVEEGVGDDDAVDPVDVGEEDEGAALPSIQPFVIDGVTIQAA